MLLNNFIESIFWENGILDSYSLLMCDSCHIRHLMKCPNWCRTWNICFLLIFSWKMLQPNFAFWDIFMLLRCLNSKEIKLQSSIRVICIIFDLIFFSWKLKIKQIFQVRRLFQRFVKRRIWHEEHIKQKAKNHTTQLIIQESDKMSLFCSTII